MAIVVTDQGGNIGGANPQTSISFTSASATAAGDKWIIVVGYKNDSGTTFAVTVDGQTATQITNWRTSRGPNATCTVGFYFDDTTGRASGKTVTCTFTGTQSSGGTIHGLSIAGVDTGQPELTPAGATGLGTAPSTGSSGSPGSSTDDYVAVGGYNEGINSSTNTVAATSTPTSGWSTLPVQNDSVRSTKSNVAYQVLSAPASAATLTWTDSSGQWAAKIVLIKATAAPSGDTYEETGAGIAGYP